jgi:FkbM family methyltransferase
MSSWPSLAGGWLRRLDGVADTDLHRALPAGLRVGRAIAPDLRDRLWIVLASVLLGTRRLRRPLRIRVRGPKGPRPFVLSDLAGMLVLAEVFCDAEYGADLPQPPRRVLDLGSNVGASILYFALRYPEARIVGVEASPRLFRLLERNVGDLPNVTLHNAAVSASSAPVTFFEGVSSWSGSTLAGDWVQGDRCTVVDGIPLDALLASEDVDLVKIDIEGAEFEALPASRRLAAVPAVLGEIHAPPGSARTGDVLALFEGRTISSTPGEAGGGSTVFSAVAVPA